MHIWPRTTPGGGIWECRGRAGEIAHGARLASRWGWAIARVPRPPPDERGGAQRESGWPAVPEIWRRLGTKVPNVTFGWCSRTQLGWRRDCYVGPGWTARRVSGFSGCIRSDGITRGHHGSGWSGAFAAEPGSVAASSWDAARWVTARCIFTLSNDLAGPGARRGRAQATHLSQRVGSVSAERIGWGPTAVGP
jgi:hypothetical protein